MFGLRLITLIQIVLGVLLTQATTAVLVVLALRSAAGPQTWGLWVALGVAVGLLAALLLNALGSRGRQEALARAREAHARERERIRVQAEREKAKIAERGHRQRRRAQAGAELKAFAGLAVLGALLLFSQIYALGLLLLGAGGGAVAGYRLRMRQERRAAAGRPALHATRPGGLLDWRGARPTGKTEVIPSEPPKKTDDSTRSEIAARR